MRHNVLATEQSARGTSAGQDTIGSREKWVKDAWRVRDRWIEV